MIDLIVKDSAVVGQTYAAVSEGWASYSDVELMSSSGSSQYTLDTDKLAAYDLYIAYCSASAYTAMGKSRATDAYYIKSEYDEDGNLISGTHVTGFYAGTSLLICGEKATVDISITDTGSNGSAKAVYDMDAGERTVNYSVQPYLEVEGNSSTSSEATSGKTTVVVTVTLPDGLNYDEGSSFCGGEVIVPEITIGEDGTTTLDYTLVDVTVGAPLDAITFSCTIGHAGTMNDVVNNQSLTASASISSTGDNRVKLAEFGNYSSVGLVIVKLVAISISKQVDARLIEQGGSFSWTFLFANESDAAQYWISDTGQKRSQNQEERRGQSIRLTGVTVETGGNQRVEYGVTAQKLRSDRSVLESQNNPNVETELVKQSGREEVFRMPIKIRRVDDDAFSVHHSHADQIGGSLQRSQSFRTDQIEQGNPPDKGELVVGWDTNKGINARKAGAILTERKLLQDKADTDEEIFFETGESFSQQSESPFFSGQWSGQNQAIPPAAVNVGEIRTSSERGRIRKAKGDEVFVYINPHVSGETLELVRRSQAMKNIQQEKTPPPRITGAFQRVPMGQDNAGIQGIRLQKMALVQREENQSASMGEVLQKELDRLSGRSQAHRSESIGTVRKNGKESDVRSHDSGEVVYTSYLRKTTKKEAILEHRAEKELKKEAVTEKRLFVRELGSLLNQDARKREAVKKMQQEEMIGQAELERETAADAARTAGLPARIRIAQIKVQLQQKLVGVAAGIGKYLAIFGGVIFMLLFLIVFFAALFGSLAGEEEENSTQYAVSGSEIVEYAQSWIGITQYSYGAGRGSATDWQDYSDCSSFVHGVFNHFGIETGWTTTAMEDDGTLVEGGLSDALPGDIILFYTGSVYSGGSSHVGIYAGNGMMVHNSVSKGVCMSSVASDGRPYVVRRIITGTTSGNSTDNTAYTQAQMETILAIVCQEDGGSYAGALAVISTAMNRVDSAQWAYLGSNAYAQLTAPGQFCYSIDTYWQRYLNGNVPDYVKQAVSDCLEDGIRNHTYTSFRSYYTEGSVQIGGGNYYFG